MSTLSGASCKIQVQRDVLVRVLLRHACEALEMQPWCSRLCFKNERLDNDQRAGEPAADLEIPDIQIYVIRRY